MEGGICDSGFSRIEDAEFLQKVSASYRKCVMQMQNLQRKYPQVLEKARCRCNYTTLVPKRASTTANIKGLQIHQLPKEHLHKRINREYRYIWYQKSKSSSLYLFQSRYTVKFCFLFIWFAITYWEKISNIFLRDAYPT